MSTAEPFADVVKHQPEVQQLDFVGVAGQLGEKRQLLFVFSGLKAFYLLDQFKRMLVHGVDMIGVMEDHTKQPAEFRDKRPEDPAAVHFQECLVNPLLPLEYLEKRQVGRCRTTKSVIDQLDMIA